MLFEWLFPMQDMKSPDIYIIGLQEIVDLNAKNIVLSSNSSKVEFWKILITKHLQKVDNYVVLKTLDLVGIFSIVFVKESLKENVKNIDSLIVRTGLLGTMGNKGNLMIRFEYLNTSFSFAVCHLSAGSTNVNARITEINDIFNRTYSIKNVKFRDHDIEFILGDLNFRIDLDYATCRQMIQSKCLSALAAYDQLNKAKTVSTSLIELDEGPLNFDPTYKYIFGSSEYDSKKKRVPSWCDRILFRKSKLIELIDYNRVEYTFSDHKPIYGLYKITTNKIDYEKRNQIIEELKEKIIYGNEEEHEMQNNLTSNLLCFIIDYINDDFFNLNKCSSNENNNDFPDVGEINISNDKNEYNYIEST
jgi:hypothetical protein